MLEPKSRLYFYDVVGELGIQVWSTSQRVSDEDFTAYLDAFCAASGAVRPKALLNFAYNFVPSAKNRAHMKEREVELGFDRLQAVAVISDSMVVRGAVTALSWAMPGPKTRAYAPGYHGRALDWLKEFARFDAVAARARFIHGAVHVGVDLREQATIV